MKFLDVFRRCQRSLGACVPHIVQFQLPNIESLLGKHSSLSECGVSATHCYTVFTPLEFARRGLSSAALPFLQVLQSF